MTAELFVGIAFGLWIAITAYTVFRHFSDGKAKERPVARDKRQTVTLSDPLLDDADLVYTFDSKAERQAFTLGVEAGRDATITGMKLRKRIPATADIDFIVEKTMTQDEG